MPREKQIEGNETPGKARRSICELHSKDCLRNVSARTGYCPFGSIVFSHGEIRHRPHFEPGLFRALYSDNCASPTPSSLKMFESGYNAQSAPLVASVCAKFGIFMGTCFSDTVHANDGSWNNGARAARRIKVILTGGYIIGSHGRGDAIPPAVHHNN
jgi:hypothetical protein